MKILYQGSPGAYSHLAANQIYPDAEAVACKTFDECFRRADEEKNLKIIIPESNRITGNIGIEYLIFKHRLNIYAEHFHKVSHNLMTLPGIKIKNVKSVRSHSQAISQCQKVIKENNLEPIIAADTAGSAKFISINSKKDEAAIASTLAAKIYNLEIIKKNIEDDKKNVTRFLIMSKDKNDIEPSDSNIITTLVFVVRSIPASLYKCLGGFASNGVNITKLESYIHPQGFDVAQFYIDFEGHPENNAVKLALEEMKFFCKEIKILGVYKKSDFRKK